MDELRIPILLALAGFALAPTPAHSRPAGWPPIHEAQVSRDSVIVQVTRTMSLDLPADADTAFPLFGPVREVEWSPAWKPAFVAPLQGAQTSDGAVFTTGEGEAAVLWVMTDYDAARRQVRYVHVRTGQLVAQLWIEVIAASPRTSRAEVTYRYTLLGPGGKDAIAHFIDAFPMFKHHWEEAIGGALAGKAGDHQHP